MKKCPPPTLKTIGFLIVYVLFFHNTVFTQTSYLINGRNLVQLQDRYYDVTSNDTLLIDTTKIILVLNSCELDSSINKVVSLGLENYSELRDGRYVFKLSNSNDFISTINSLSAISEIEEIVFGYLIRMNQSNISKREIQGSYPGMSFMNSGDPLYPDDEHQYEYWELYRTSVVLAPGYGPTEFAWNYSVGNPQVKVAIIDNGLVWNDNDFYPNNNEGYDYYDNDDDVTPPIPSGFDIEMGTAKTSIIAARTANQHALCGVAGGYYSGQSSQPVSIISLRAFNDNCQLGSTIGVVQSIYHAINHGAKIINLGFWRFDEVPVIDDAISYASEMGILMFAPVGDNNFDPLTLPDPIAWPARRDDVIAVGGTDYYDHRAVWYGGWGSSWGSGTEISLPATDIEVRDIYGPNGNDPGTWLTSTTEVSCSLATGIAALVLSVNPCLTAEEVKSILYESCEKVGGYNYTNGWSEELGYGVLNAYLAVSEAFNMLEPGGEITNVVEYNEPKWITGNIRIQSGGFLTVKSTVKMAAGTKIIVEEGGVLNLDGGAITNMCGGFWKGIEVHGNPALPQLPSSNQGRVMITDGIIENAQVGIGVCDSLEALPISGFAQDGGGGIVEATNLQIRNCPIGVTFAPYEYGNLSYFKLGSISFDDKLLENGSVAGGVLMNSINGLDIIGLEISNQNSSMRHTGYGIRSFNSDFMVDYFCDDIESPCPEGYAVKSKFTKFTYGIHAVNIGTNKFVRVHHSLFDDNKYGMYGSALLLPEVLHNQFEAYNGVSYIPSYGLYLNNCIQYQVEDNTFNGNTDPSYSDVGIYINNSGGQNNYIYNNRFNTLQFGTVADGINRDTKAETGLCFKCNDFVGCANDIFVPLPVIPPVSRNHGIRAYQGTPGSLDTDAAGNTFSVDADYNIYNDLNHITYVHHHYTNPEGIKIIPTERTENTVSLYRNDGTTYKKSVSCPSEMVQGEKEELREQMLGAEDGKETTETQLSAFIDGGDTETLNDEVQTAQPSSSLSLYEELLATSPYLSDTVMKSSIERTDVLPDAMLRDVLVANPQSAKSGDVMNALELRPVPLPEEMKDEIKEGINVFASKDMLHGQLAYWNDRWSKAYNGLSRVFAKDSICNRMADSLALLYNSTNTKDAKYALAFLEAERGNTIASQQALNSVVNNFILTSEEMGIQTYHAAFINELASLQQESTGLLDPDSLALVGLSTLAVNDAYLPGAAARNILHAAGVLEYTEPINLNLIPKSCSTNAAGNSKLDTDLTNSYLEVYPNPAADHCFARYSGLAEGINYLQIADLNGQVLRMIKLLDKRNSVVVPLVDFASGTYLIQLLSNGRNLQTVQIVVR